MLKSILQMIIDAMLAFEEEFVSSFTKITEYIKSQFPKSMYDDQHLFDSLNVLVKENAVGSIASFCIQDEEMISPDHSPYEEVLPLSLSNETNVCISLYILLEQSRLSNQALIQVLIATVLSGSAFLIFCFFN